MKADEILSIAVNALNDKKARELAAVKVEDLTVITDYFVFATATSSTHVHALADEVEFKLKEAGVVPHHTEGRGTGWFLLDYGFVIIHIFSRDAREFYGLDKMWSDGKAVDLTQILKSETED